jgi:cytochrome oxidase Cu insertion factor (SCO1/SenC/PrrC family)
MMTRPTLTRTAGAVGAIALAACLWLPHPVAANDADEIGPAVGAPAPDFELSDTDGHTHTLAEHREERPVVMVFFRGAW